MISPKDELLPCPFCGGNELEVDLEGGFVVCQTCNCYGPEVDNSWTPEQSDEEAPLVRAKAAEFWNKRAPIPQPPVIPCEFPGCGNPADYEGWYRRRDPFMGTPTGHIVMIAFCESCKSHPHLCANEPKPEKPAT